MTETVQRIAIDELMPDPSQPRKTFIREEIEWLAASIAALDQGPHFGSSVSASSRAFESTNVNPRPSSGP